MARPLRLEFSGALYHVTARGNERKNIYFEELDFELFLSILSAVCLRHNWVVHAYCLMSNHYHLLIETPDANLSKGMRQLNGVFTQKINRKHSRVGHLFQGRYKAILVEKDNYLLELSRYIVLNPVRANMVDNPEDWPWSSWHVAMGKQSKQEWLATDALLLMFDKQRGKARKAYFEFVRQGKGISPWSNLKNQVFLGDDDFVNKYVELAEQQNELSEVPNKQTRKKPLSLGAYKQKHQTRNQAIIEAYQSGGYTLKEIGEYFNLHYSRVSKIANNKT